MNNIKLILLSFLLLIPSLAFSQDKPPVIEVTGNAQIKIEADMMEMYISVRVNMDDLQDAKNKNDEATREVLNVLKELNIEDKDIITSSIRMSRNYIDNNNYNKEKKYNVSNEITVKTPNISAYEDITTKLIRIDNVFVNNIILSSTKTIETRAKAREDALLAAKKKAEDMAAIYNMALGKPILIQEIPGSYYPNPFNNVSTENTNENTLDRVESIFKAGLVSVNSSVKVIFILLDK